MAKEWLIETRGDPLQAMREVLGAVWRSAALEGVVLPLRNRDGRTVRAVLATDPSQLAEFDPLAPVMESNSAREIWSRRVAAPTALLGAVARPCELRSLSVLFGQDGGSLGRLLRISVDCWATFSEEEFARRAQMPRGAESMSEENLRFARQGGIAAYRYRTACQICPSPSAEDAELTLGLIGLPLRKHFLLIAQSEDVSERFGLGSIAARPAPREAMEGRREAIKALVARRGRKSERLLSSLAPDLPQDVAGLLDHLRSCEPCRDCLDACPTCQELLDLGSANTGPLLEAAKEWIVRCSGCGMCDQACPRGYPLNEVIRRLAHSLSPETLSA